MDARKLSKMMESEDWDAAIAFTGEAIATDPKSSSAWLNRGVVLYEIVRQNCRIFANDSFAWLVVLFDKSGRMRNEAKERIKSLFGPLHASRLETLLDEAKHCFDKAIELDPGANAHLWRGILYRDTGRFEHGESDLRRAVELAEADMRETAQYHLNALHNFNWTEVARTMMSAEFAYYPVEDHYGDKVSRVLQAITRN